LSSVDGANASGAKASTKQRKSRLEVIQGHAFGDNRKADETLRITVWALDFRVGNFERKV